MILTKKVLKCDAQIALDCLREIVVELDKVEPFNRFGQNLRTNAQLNGWREMQGLDVCPECLSAYERVKKILGIE